MARPEPAVELQPRRGRRSASAGPSPRRSRGRSSAAGRLPARWCSRTSTCSWTSDPGRGRAGRAVHAVRPAPRPTRSAGWAARRCSRARWSPRTTRRWSTQEPRRGVVSRSTIVRAAARAGARLFGTLGRRGRRKQTDHAEEGRHEGALIHGVLLAVMLIYGYRTWTRDKSVKPDRGAGRLCGTSPRPSWPRSSTRPSASRSASSSGATPPARTGGASRRRSSSAPRRSRRSRRGRGG